MDEIAKKIENAKKQPLTVENLNYIGDLYLKKGDKTTAIAYYYELAEKLHISQKDKKLAIYKKIINISTSESKAYEKIINIFSRMGLAAEEKKYIMMLANLYQNKGEMNKLDALHRRINEIDPEYHATAKGKQDDSRSVHEGIVEKKKDILLLADDISDKSLSGNKDRDKEEPAISIEHPDELHKRLEKNTVEGRRNEGPVFHAVGFIPGLRNYFKYIALCFLLILMGFSIYLYQGKSARQRNSAGTDEIAVQTGNFEIHVKKLTDIKELEGRISESDRNKNYFYSLSIKAKTSCIGDDFASSPHSKMFFIDKNGTQISANIKGLDGLTRTIYKTNICGKNAGAIFMRVIFGRDRKAEYAKISLDGLEKDGRALITWD